MIVIARAIIERQTDEGTELLLQVRDREYGMNQMEFPGGKLEEFESIVDCVRREVLEETGLSVTKILDDTHRTVMIGEVATTECLKPFCVYQTLEGPVDTLGFYFRCHAEGTLLEKGDGAHGHRWIAVTELTEMMQETPEVFMWGAQAALKFYLTHSSPPPVQ